MGIWKKIKKVIEGKLEQFEVEKHKLVRLQRIDQRLEKMQKQGIKFYGLEDSLTKTLLEWDKNKTKKKKKTSGRSFRKSKTQA